MPEIIYEIDCPPCWVCGQIATVTIPQQAYVDWKYHGKRIQEAWPEASAADRELLLTGLHEACWPEAYPPGLE